MIPTLDTVYFQVSLERMLKIEAQSSSSSRRRFSVPSSSSSSSSSHPAPSNSAPGATEASLYPSATTLHPPAEQQLEPLPSVLVTIVHSPLHMGCFFQAPAIRSTNPAITRASPAQQQKGCSGFSLASPSCARVFPLRRCDWEGRGGGGAGAALFAAAAAVKGGGGGDGSTEGQVSAEEVPREERLRYRYGLFFFGGGGIQVSSIVKAPCQTWLFVCFWRTVQTIARLFVAPKFSSVPEIPRPGLLRLGYCTGFWLTPLLRPYGTSSC